MTRDPIDATALLARVRHDSDGAIVLFSGVVRDHAEGRAVSRLTYEAYEAMAVAGLERICEQVREEFEIGDVAVVHRIGELNVGEASVAIAVAAPHREAAYAASRQVIERLKKEVPIWKRERYTDGDEAWLEGTVPPSGM
ncbi:MAG: molybdenum cofactor biosynthesis protein MoaE [Gemmatimonadota bacterium]|nr:MAG: molybdenum cofactor biosynthesis protein MoaE [Gemmatimonadota bacterium]